MSIQPSLLTSSERTGQILHILCTTLLLDTRRDDQRHSWVSMVVGSRFSEGLSPPVVRDSTQKMGKFIP